MINAAHPNLAINLNIFRTLTHISNPIERRMLDSDQRNILIANRVAIILSLLALILCIILVSTFGVTITTPIILGVSLFFYGVTFINKWGFIDLGRVLLCVVPTIVTIGSALLAKLTPGFTDILFYDARFFLVLLAIVPCLIFNSSEHVPLYSCLGFLGLVLLCFDPIHEAVGLGYYQNGFTGPSYYYINYVAMIAFFGIVAGALSLKRVIENKDHKNQQFKNDLIEKNSQLSFLLADMEQQKREITAQSHELLASQEQLVAANHLIEKQKQELQRQVSKANLDLEEANDELIRHNNELRQFSYTISHNLRGPIARLLGLAQVAHLDENIHRSKEAMAVINHIKTSAMELDNVIRDLNEVLDVRKGVNQIKTCVTFEEEWREVKSLLHISDAAAAEHFRIDFSRAPEVTSVPAMINSILYNLISNSIKYQSAERKLLIEISTYREDSYVVLLVKDNGLGIDLNRFREDMFKMYKRFHNHQEGKGIGLYLVKSQAESLHGYVEVESGPDVGACFSVFIKDSSPT